MLNVTFPSPAQSTGNSLSYAERLNGALAKAVEAHPGAELFTDKFDKVENYLKTFESAPNAEHKLDRKGNAVTIVPEFGSLKKTKNGFEMSVRRETDVPQRMLPPGTMAAGRHARYLRQQKGAYAG